MSAADFMHLPLAARIFIGLMFAPVVWATGLAIVAVVGDVGRYLMTVNRSRAAKSGEDPKVAS
jgi:hypothetical protein